MRRWCGGSEGVGWPRGWERRAFFSYIPGETPYANDAPLSLFAKLLLRQLYCMCSYQSSKRPYRGLLWALSTQNRDYGNGNGLIESEIGMFLRDLFKTAPFTASSCFSPKERIKHHLSSKFETFTSVAGVLRDIIQSRRWQHPPWHHPRAIRFISAVLGQLLATHRG